MKNVEWTQNWPTEPGLYWFYGWAFGKSGGDAPSFHFVKAFLNGQGTITCIRDGHFFYKCEGAVGQFTPVILPELPA